MFGVGGNPGSSMSTKVVRLDYHCKSNRGGPWTRVVLDFPFSVTIQQAGQFLTRGAYTCLQWEQRQSEYDSY